MTAPAGTRTASLGSIRPFVRAATELRCFGRAWSLAGAALLAGGAVLAGLGHYNGAEAAALVAVVGFSTACVLGGLLLAKRTGPDVLYTRILDLAPVLDPGVPLEPPDRTFRRTLWPALLLPLTLTAFAPFLVGAVLLVVGQPREEVLGGLAALGPPAAGAWTLVCGIAGLRMASYFERWERRHGMRALCLPLRAGLMQHVYRVVPDNPRGDARPVG